jgi:hypothetical protein
MMRSIRTMRRGVLGLAFTGALGFGASQALASPAAPAAAQSCDTVCNRVCRAAGFIGGFCGDGVSCSCYL